MSTSVELGRARAWAWVAHLRAGGTTPWAAWQSADGPEASPPREPIAGSARGGRFLPGAQQLELLRRLNLAGRPSTALADRVLAASAPGRGRPDLELVGVDVDRRFGPPAVDPAELPDDELLRVATGLLAAGLVERRESAVPSPDRQRFRVTRRFRPRYELAGDPWLAAAYTSQLVADGRPPGGGGRSVHVLGTGVAAMLAHTWAAGAFGEGAPSWPDFLAKVRARRRLPRRVALPEVVDRFRARPHTGRVGVVLDPAALPRLVGVRRLDAVVDPPAHATELARQVGSALSLLVLPAEQTQLLDTVLRPRLAAATGGLPTVPPEHRDWVDDAAFALRQRLLRAGYPVLGDPDVLLTTPPDRPVGSVLDLAIELLLEEEAT
ncbi:MAG TPA: hypothetical protein VFV89_10295 [Nocardioides sp.]|uniref:hypothetical protein n=1 Tax=Nocardioides sp. TaxID=35761 RepID=UPI002E33D8CF|nr:hypothetical protein [Nocardioides sp.]HEX5088188.1 hypothetical protein [Nocardioides sp.]